jgi:hypothetical protein
MLIESETSNGLGIAGDSALDGLQETIQGLLTPACRGHWVRFAAIGEDLDKLRGMRRGELNLVCLVRPGEGRIVDDAPQDVLQAAWERVEHVIASDVSDPCARRAYGLSLPQQGTG